MVCCLIRRAIAAGLSTCLLLGWTDRVFADTANDPNPNPNLQIYQQPKLQNAIDDKLQNGGANQNAPSDEGGTSDGMPDSNAGSTDDVQNGPTSEGDYDDTKSEYKKKPDSGGFNFPLGPIINLIPPLIEQQQQKPDLSFAQSDASLDESTRQVALSFCVVNGGEGASKPTKVAIRSSGQAVGTYAIEALSPGEQICRDDISASVPAGFAGTRRYELAVDPTKLVAETREDNNTAVATVEIRSLPDLTIASFSAKPDAASRKVALPLCIGNLGKSAVDKAEVSIRDSTTSEIVASTSVGPLPAGGRLCPSSLSAAVPADFSGKRVYDAEVDPQNRIAEANEENNAATATVSISALPDLTIAGATVKFDEASRQAALSFCVVNRGKVAVKQTNVSIRDQAGANTIASPTIGAIAPGAQVCQKVPAAVPDGFAGTRKYKLTVDPQGRISEANEDNNATSVALKVQAQQPDLAIADSSASFDAATRQVTISYCVVNRGKSAAKDSDVTVRDSSTGEVVATRATGLLAAGGRACSKDLPARLPEGFSGTRQFDLAADAKQVIVESDEDNNIAAVTADVSAQPDLTISDASVKFDEAAREMVLSFCVINRGQAPAVENRVSVRDPAAAEIQSLRIAPLASNQRTCRDGLLLPVAAGFSGLQRYELSVDPDGKVAELDETNNAAQTEARVSAAPNLVFASSSARFDETARHALLSFCVINRGEAVSNEGTVSIRDSGTVVGTVKLGALSDSNQACFTDVAMPTLEDFAGTRSYELAADAGDTTSESDENDNTRTLSVAVPELPAPTEYATAAGSNSEPESEPMHVPLVLVVITIAGVAALSGGIIFVLVRPRRGKQVEHIQPDSIQFRGRPDPGAQVTHSAAAEIVLPRLQLRGRADPGRQRIEMRKAALRIAGE